MSEDEAVRIAREVLECAVSWHPDACLLGNVRADDIADMCRTLIAAHSARDRAAKEAPEVVRLAQKIAANQLGADDWAAHEIAEALIASHAREVELRMALLRTADNLSHWFSPGQVDAPEALVDNSPADDDAVPAVFNIRDLRYLAEVP